MSKSFVCTCEDVSVEDVRQAIALGYRDIESVKRYTGFGTGVCQGKNCLAAVAKLLREEGGLTDAATLPFTPRPPARPVSLGEFASIPEHVIESAPGPGVPPPLHLYESAPEGIVHPLASREPLPEHADVVIIGAGIMGLGLAWNLARRGRKDVLVLDKGYLCAGASGRNGGGVRMQWTTPTNIRLARRSIELCKGFAREFKINTWFRQGGYLFLAPDEEQAKRLERNAKIHHANGVKTELLGTGGARDLVPELDGSRFVAAAFNPEDGVLFPWPFLWGYAKACAQEGVRLETFTQVHGIEQARGRVTAVRTSRGTVQCDTLVNAAGAWSKDLAKLAGVSLPNEPFRHEICSTEPLKPWLGPLVSVLGTSLYFSQSMRGEIVGGMGDPKEPAGLEMGSTLRFLSRYGRALTSCVPRLADVKVIRQWAGCYDVTPDNNPILGDTPGLANFQQLNGFVGHGFMMAPAVTELMAQAMTGEAPDEIFERFSLRRFAEGRIEKEDFIIG